MSVYGQMTDYPLIEIGRSILSASPSLSDLGFAKTLDEVLNELLVCYEIREMREEFLGGW